MSRSFTPLPLVSCMAVAGKLFFTLLIKMSTKGNSRPEIKLDKCIYLFGGNFYVLVE
jgi:hypothetical protein